MGLLLQSHSGGHCRLHFTFGIMVQDGASQKYCLCVKGDSGSKFCAKCSNVYSIAHIDSSFNDDEDFEGGVCMWLKKEDLVLTSDEDFYKSWDRLAERFGSCNKIEFERWQQAQGFTYSARSLLSSVPLRSVAKPLTAYMHDWMHCLCHNGCLNIACFLLMDALNQELKTWSNFESYAKLWQLPAASRQVCSSLGHLFYSKRIESYKQSKKINAWPVKCSAYFQLYSTMRHYWQTCLFLPWCC